MNPTENRHNLSSTPDAQGADVPPRFGGVRLGPTIAGALYLLLVGSAAFALWVREFPGRLPVQLSRAAPWVFLVFVVCFAVYRLVLMRAAKYPAFKGFFQIGAALLFFMLLLPKAQHRFDNPQSELAGYLNDGDARVRRLAAEVARHRPEGKHLTSSLVTALDDPDDGVRAEAHRSLVAITGEDLGDPGQAGAVAAWGAKYGERRGAGK